MISPLIWGFLFLGQIIYFWGGNMHVFMVKRSVPQDIDDTILNLWIKPCRSLDIIRQACSCPIMGWAGTRLAKAASCRLVPPLRHLIQEAKRTPMENRRTELAAISLLIAQEMRETTIVYLACFLAGLLYFALKLISGQQASGYMLACLICIELLVLVRHTRIARRVMSGHYGNNRHDAQRVLEAIASCSEHLAVNESDGNENLLGLARSSVAQDDQQYVDSASRRHVSDWLSYVEERALDAVFLGAPVRTSIAVLSGAVLGSFVRLPYIASYIPVDFRVSNVACWIVVCITIVNIQRLFARPTIPHRLHQALHKIDSQIQSGATDRRHAAVVYRRLYTTALDSATLRQWAQEQLRLFV